jgi:hypothetical protein
MSLSEKSSENSFDGTYNKADLFSKLADMQNAINSYRDEK